MHGGLLLNGFAADQMKAEPKDKQCAYPLDHAINNSVFVESHKASNLNPNAVPCCSRILPRLVSWV